MPVKKTQAEQGHCSPCATASCQDSVAHEPAHSHVSHGSSAEHSPASTMHPLSATASIPTAVEAAALPGVALYSSAITTPRTVIQDKTKTVSPAHAAEQHVQSQKGCEENTPHAQLTELLSASDPKSCWPPSDRNHNVAAFYLLSNPDTLASTHNYGLALQKDVDIYGSADPLTTFRPDSFPSGGACYSEDKTEVLNHGHVLTSPQNYAYYSAHTHSQLAGQVCRNYSLSSAADDERNYSSSEVSTYSPGENEHTPPLSDFHTPPLTASNASTGSPGSVQWSPGNGAVSAEHHNVYMPSVSAAATGTGVLEDTPQDSRGCMPGQGSSLHASYYSDEQSLEEDAMLEIQQDILRADIQRHIYDNYHQEMIMYPPEDEDPQDETENFSPKGRSGQRKAAGGAKKRRRRTQTPVQRSAANMRERKRMCHLNVAFNSLKDRLPNVRNRKKLSRIQTLKAAIFYISLLTECLQSS